MRALSIGSQGPRRQVRVDGLHRWLLVETSQPAEDELLLKQLLPAFAHEPQVAEQWLVLAERNAGLAHPTCAKVVDWGGHEETLGVTSRQARGVALGALMQGQTKAGEPWSTDLVIHIACELLDALAYTQEREPGLVHLDLDPTGVLVRMDGTLLLPEFGLWSALSPATLARCRFDAGRVRYASPELVRSLPCDPRSDIFSLGILLYELLANQRPFVGSTQLVVAMAIADGKHRPLRDVASEVPESLSDVIEMMLAPRPEDRFQSAAAARQALASQRPASTCDPARWQGELATRCLERAQARAAPIAEAEDATSSEQSSSEPPVRGREQNRPPAPPPLFASHVRSDAQLAPELPAHAWDALAVSFPIPSSEACAAREPCGLPALEPRPLVANDGHTVHLKQPRASLQALPAATFLSSPSASFAAHGTASTRPWWDPSSTVFRRRRPNERTTVEARATPVAVILLSVVFGFSAVASAYLLVRYWW